jgi:DNA-binding transcriptional LysR family regulator
MDINLIRTFLEVNRTRHFGHAAENLCLTQSAVSARVRLLEETVGVALFTRQRNNIELTPAGTKFLVYADTLLNTWRRAVQDVATTGPEQSVISIGGTPSLWDIFLQDWLANITESMPTLCVNAEVHHSEMLFRKILDRTLDVIVSFEALHTSEVEVTELRTVELMLVSTDERITPASAVLAGYVYVDWGTFFAMQHAQNFPDIPPPCLRVQTGRLALDHILRCGGSAYLPQSMIEDALEEKKLFTVAEAPIIQRMTYASYLPTSDKSEIVTGAIAQLVA